MYAPLVEHWESYVLGAFGILLAIASLVFQIVALALGRPWSALLYTIGVVAGAFLYRTGYRQLSQG
jgi:hypothetical protein